MNRNKMLWVFLVWTGLVLSGLTGLSLYSHTPNVEHLRQTEWNEVLLGPRSEGYTLIYLLHPQCPCTLASNFEIQRILQREYPDLNILTIIRTNDTTISSPIGGDILYDANGYLSRTLGINTSGHVILYNSEGNAIYSGGVTPSRGHRGNSFGGHSLRQLLSKNPNNDQSENNTTTYFTYGCKLNERNT